MSIQIHRTYKPFSIVFVVLFSDSDYSDFDYIQCIYYLNYLPYITNFLIAHLCYIEAFLFCCLDSDVLCQAAPNMPTPSQLLVLQYPCHSNIMI